MAKAEGVFPCYKNQFHIGDAAGVEERHCEVRIVFRVD